MGDTIAHLGSREEVAELIGRVHRALVPGGLFVLSFRNYDRALVDTGRFIPVRSDDNRIAMCVLEYAESTVEVTDVLWERSDGGWSMTTSSYSKLRLPVEWIIACVESAGFTVVKNESMRGMVTLVGKKDAER
jgi:hypothetical protein